MVRFESVESLAGLATGGKRRGRSAGSIEAGGSAQAAATSKSEKAFTVTASVLVLCARALIRYESIRVKLPRKGTAAAHIKSSVATPTVHPGCRHRTNRHNPFRTTKRTAKGGFGKGRSILRELCPSRSPRARPVFGKSFTARCIAKPLFRRGTEFYWTGCSHPVASAPSSSLRIDIPSKSSGGSAPASSASVG